MFTNQDLKRLILPLIVEQILAVSVGMVDTMMVSNAGEAATSGVSLVDMVNTLFINILRRWQPEARWCLPVSGTEEKGQGLPVGQPADFDNCMISLIIMVLCILFPGGYCICSTAAWPGM